ncbi:MAG TPA: PDZ domain-containing protein [Pirellulales bacterium]|nr:PDZ domain-containing protein [Pirellulales bacterium]
MNRPLVTFGILASWSFAACDALAQPAVDRLERRVRELAQQEGAAADDADIGYLGVVADDPAAKGQGVELLEVHEGSPAEKSGLEAGDLVTKIGDKPVRTLDDFAAAVAGQPVGKTLRITIERHGKPQDIEVTLGPRPPPGARRFAKFGPISGEPQPLRRVQLGVRVEECDVQAATAAGAPVARGAVVSRVAAGSPAAAAGIPLKAIIVAVDGQEVDNPDDLKRIIARARPGQEVKIDYYSRGKLIQRNLRLAEIMPAVPAAPLADPEPPESTDESLTDRQRVERLERRVRALEARIAEFERFLGGAPEP